MQNVLITGASGLLGSRLTALLLKQGYGVHHLGRTAGNHAQVKNFVWNPARQYLDPKAFEGVTAIIHLAGANMAEGRWTAERKKELRDSRVKTTQLLHRHLQQHPHTVTCFIQASAVGYYGNADSQPLTEESPPGKGFVPQLCRDWEAAAKPIAQLGIRHVSCRIGIVLAPNGGALPELTKTFAVGVAGYFTPAPMYYPWVHIDDVCGIMLHALQHPNLQGPVNTTAPQPLPMKTLMQEIIAAKKAGAVLLPVPTPALKLLTGEMAEMLLMSQNVVNKKITESGYRFKYSTLKAALKAIYRP